MKHSLFSKIYEFFRFLEFFSGFESNILVSGRRLAPSSHFDGTSGAFGLYSSFIGHQRRLGALIEGSQSKSAFDYSI